MKRCHVVTGVLLALLMGGCGDPAATAEKYRNKGKAYFEAGDFDKARVEYLNALRIDANDPEARYGVGQAFEQLGSASQALGHYTAAIEVDPDHLPTRIAIAKLFVMGRSADRAQEHIEAILAVDPQHPDGRALKAAAMAVNGRYAEAESLAREVVEVDPANQFAVPLLAARLSSAQRQDDARKVLEAALARKSEAVGLRGVYAEILWELGDEDGYLSQLEKIMNLEPEVSGHKVLYASALDSTGRQAEAVAFLAQQAYAPEAETALKLAYLQYLQAADADRVAGEYERLLAGSEDDRAVLLLSQADFLRREGDDARATALYEEVRATDTGRQGVRAAVALATMKLASGDLESARQIVDEIREEHPTNQNALSLSSDIAMASGDLDAAIGDLRLAIRDAQQNVDLHLKLANAYRRNGQPLLAKEVLGGASERLEDNARLLRALGDLASELNDYELVDRTADRLLDLSSSDVGALELKYRSMLARGDSAGALSVAREIGNLNPQDGLGPFFEGVALLEAGDRRGAEKPLRESLRRDPGAVEPLSTLVRLLLEQGRESDARTILEEQRTLADDSPIIDKFAGDLALAKGDVEEAEETYRRVIRDAPGLPVTYAALANMLLQQQKFAEASAVLEAGIDSTEDPQLFSLLAMMHQGQQDIASAIEVYRRALAVNPGRRDFANNLAMLLAEFRDSGEALDEALSLSRDFEKGDNPAYLDTLGWVRVRRGDYEEAVRVLRRAHDLAPDSALIQFHLAKALIGAGDEQQALEYLNAAVSKEQGFRGLDEARLLVASLSRG